MILSSLFISLYPILSQALNVVDVPELRDLLTYISVDLKDNMIPHRTQLAQLISKHFTESYSKMISEIRVSIYNFFFKSLMANTSVP